MSNPFEVLGVTAKATEAEIKAAFRAKAKECHPDTHPNDPDATKKFAAISDAYDKLKDGKAATYQHQPRQHAYQDPFSQAHADIHSTIFTNGIDVMRQMEEIHRRERERMMEARRRQRGKNDDIGVEYRISLEDAYTGTTMTATFNLRSGASKVEVKIPAGVDTGTQIRVPKGGHDYDPNLPNGDLIVVIEVVKHTVFHRHGLDLVLVADVDMFTAILGGTIQVKTIKGTTVEVTVPKGVDTGSQLRVANYGMPMPGVPGRFGDMIVGLEVRMPKKLMPAQLDLIEKARDAA